MLSFIGTVVIGLLAGLVAKFLMPGKDPGGLIITTLLGIGGSLVASYLGQYIGWYGETGIGRFIGAVVGAIILLVIYRIIKGRQTPRL